ncbi:MAG: thiolase family protein [Caldisphaera sp.]|jgi:3-oxoadipyl-CoA thiolase
MNTVWLIDGIRTPIGKHAGILSSVRPDELGALVLKTILERNKIDPYEVEGVYFGCANQAGEDNRNVARMSWLLAELPVEVPACTVNRLCGSGLEAISDAARSIMVGEGDVYIGGGVESMSRSPWVVPKAEVAFPKNHVQMYDTTIGWRFTHPKMIELGHTDSLGMTAENLVEQYNISREEQDKFALLSHQKAINAIDKGLFKNQIIPVETKKGIVEIDEGPRRDTTIEKLANLKPSFKQGGTVTAGNSSQINDAASAVLLVSEEYGKAHGLTPIAKIVSIGVAGVPPRIMGIGPVPATKKAMERAKLTLNDMDLIELNEAFAGQSLAVLKEWKIDPEDSRLNPNGGAIALGHPLGATGSILLTKALHEIKRKQDIHFALISLCIGVGQGISMIIEKI